MTKCNTEETAASVARETGDFYGRSIFDGKWYVGDLLQLKAIGVADPLPHLNIVRTCALARERLELAVAALLECEKGAALISSVEPMPADDKTALCQALAEIRAAIDMTRGTL